MMQLICLFQIAVRTTSHCPCTRVQLRNTWVCPDECGCECGWVLEKDDKVVCTLCECDCGTCYATDGGGKFKCCIDDLCDCPCGECGVGTHAAVAVPVGAPEYCCECCFPGTGTVNLESGKSVKMSELKIGDRVQTGEKFVKMSELQIGDRVQIGKKSVKMSKLQIGERVQTGKISGKCLNYR